jgi:uncharacterized protein (TIGR00255 family)
MLLSMTGFGEARRQAPKWSVHVEARTVNNRHFKFSGKLSEPFSAREVDLEHMVREKIRRGSVQVSVRIERPRRPDDYRLNLVALQSYQAQLAALPEFRSNVELASLLALPGVVEEVRTPAEANDDDWAEITSVVREAMQALESARAAEGQAMASELIQLGQLVSEHLQTIADRGPEVVRSYHTRIADRVQTLVRDHGVTVDPKDLIREVAILADRSDITEEVIRLRAHLVQFQQTIQDVECAGRKLEFIVQEMGRETNTIGSKANDVEISRGVVEIKGALEKIRELIQNVE